MHPRNLTTNEKLSLADRSDDALLRAVAAELANQITANEELQTEIDSQNDRITELEEDLHEERRRANRLKDELDFYK